MKQKKNQLDVLLTPIQKQKAIDTLIMFFETERGEKIGVLAADEILGELLDSVGKAIFNSGIEAAKKIVSEHAQSLEVDLDLLKK